MSFSSCKCLSKHNRQAIRIFPSLTIIFLTVASIIELTSNSLLVAAINLSSYGIPRRFLSR
jgi:hypothetical protein